MAIFSLDFVFKARNQANCFGEWTYMGNSNASNEVDVSFWLHQVHFRHDSTDICGESGQHLHRAVNEISALKEVINVCSAAMSLNTKKIVWDATIQGNSMYFPEFHHPY